MGVHVIIHGNVQGVGFRYFIERHAHELKLTGFVKNISNGAVEAHFSGNPENVMKMISLCRKGPAFASVKKMEIRECNEEFSGFEIR